MVAFVPGARQILAYRLPGNGPVFAGIVVTKVDVMAGAIERNAVGPETSDALVLGVFVKRIAAGVVREHGT